MYLKNVLALLNQNGIIRSFFFQLPKTPVHFSGHVISKYNTRIYQ